MIRFATLSTITALLFGAATTDAQIQWSAEMTIDSGQAAFTSVAADYDGDGDLDVFTGTVFELHLVVNDGGGTFSPPVALFAGSYHTRGLAVADIDGDGHLDVVFGDRSHVRVVYGQAGGTFGSAVTIDLTPNAGFSGITITDLDKDGDVEIAAIAPLGGFVNVYDNLGGRNFGPAMTVHSMLPTGATATFAAIEAGDFGSGSDSLVFAAPVDGVFGLIANLSTPGSLAFAPAVVLESGATSAVDVAIFDVDGDGDLDIVGAANSGTVPLRWFENDSGVGASQPIAFPSGISSIDLADLDLDGNIDIVANGGNAVRLVSHLGSGAFAAAVALPLTVNNTRGVLCADMDGDLRSDIIATGYSSQDFNLILNLGHFPGSGEDFDLHTLTNGSGIPADDIKSAAAADFLTTTMISPNGGFDFVSSPVLLAQPYATGSRPTSIAGFPEFHINPYATPAPVRLIGGGTGLLGKPLLSPGGLTVSFQIPTGFTGSSVMLQAIAPLSSAVNGFFAASDGHEIVFI